MAEDFHITLRIIDWISRQKVNKNTEYFYSTIKQLDLIDVYKTLYSTMAGYILSTAHGMFTKMDYRSQLSIILKDSSQAHYVVSP